MENISVLKLDSAFKPIEIISWEEAFLLTWLKKAWAVEYSDKWVHSATKAFQIPSVIVLFQYIDEKLFTLPCTRKNVLIRDENKCQYCGKQFREASLTLDHVIPRSKGGKSIWTNVVAACKPCNQKKRDYLVENAPVTLLRRPKRPSYRSIIKKRFEKGNLKWKEYL
jgi:5-methylcytosine-specific restriction endonuclease McrA|tara:strand:- start:2289 stop:2789 length:501 start_codon:yes stop_codon:yes gene_type:complete